MASSSSATHHEAVLMRTRPQPGARTATLSPPLGRRPYRSLSADVIRILQDTPAC